jgi:hypothetical protein
MRLRKRSFWIFWIVFSNSAGMLREWGLRAPSSWVMYGTSPYPDGSGRVRLRTWRLGVMYRTSRPFKRRWGAEPGQGAWRDAVRH